MKRPEKDASWYLKWSASILLLIGLTIRVADIQGEYRFYDNLFSLLGALCWVAVGRLWKDNAILLTNSPYVIMLAIAIIMALT